MVAGGADARLLSSLNMELGQLFSDAVGRICDKAGVDPSWLGFVASRGQTVWHEPDASRVYADGKRYHAPTLQLGEPALIAYDHNVRVVANVRAMDMAAGGQGAPLVPFSEVVLYGADDCNRALLNIGGIGNVTVLPAGRCAADVFAFDTGPGNMMVDEACRRSRSRAPSCSPVPCCWARSSSRTPHRSRAHPSTSPSWSRCRCLSPRCLRERAMLWTQTEAFAGVPSSPLPSRGRRRFSCAGSCSTKGSCRSSAAFARQARGAPPALYAEYAQ